MGWSYNIPALELTIHTRPLADLTAEEFLKAYDLNLEISIKNFFGDSKIQKLVLDNNWEKIFYEWRGKHPANEYNWPVSILAMFLWLAGIDFWNYLPYESNMVYHIGNMEWSSEE